METVMQKIIPLGLGLGLAVTVMSSHAACPALLDHTMQRLHSGEQLNLCNEFAGKPVLIVNTASHCGFTPQFSALESLHQTYRDRGVGFLGVASDSFFQAAKSEAEAAEVCYVNYGVSFPMMAPVEVTGDRAHPLFREIAEQSSAPRWNFYKYVVDRDGKVAGRFASSVKPDDPQITELLDRLVATDP